MCGTKPRLRWHSSVPAAGEWVGGETAALPLTRGLYMKLTMADFLSLHGLSWYTLYKRGVAAKSTCHSWIIGTQLPCDKSATKIARVLGLPLAEVRRTLKTRNPWENSPRVKWGTHVRARSSSTDIQGRLESAEPVCLTCGSPLLKSA